ncbi:hypothetical protein SCHPADRAFT_947329 [Schizopora paradoxa]|uniref:Uncharacterized protein n=1 Tax=Schizopora paradoxa TaxID=27342 RepID=A0A0H2R0Z8_9AGAM|nr:hypothetical protein SCHPADRAFT_947329 [Schizopora paradoxa]
MSDQRDRPGNHPPPVNDNKGKRKEGDTRAAITSGTTLQRRHTDAGTYGGQSTTVPQRGGPYSPGNFRNTTPSASPPGATRGRDGRKAPAGDTASHTTSVRKDAGPKSTTNDRTGALRPPALRTPGRGVPLKPSLTPASASARRAVSGVMRPSANDMVSWAESFDDEERATTHPDEREALEDAWRVGEYQKRQESDAIHDELNEMDLDAYYRRRGARYRFYVPGEYNAPHDMPGFIDYADALQAQEEFDEEVDKAIEEEDEDRRVAARERRKENTVAGPSRRK